MADDVNFLPEQQKKKSAPSVSSIEYTSGGEPEPIERSVELPAFTAARQNVEKTKQSFTEWRLARKKKRDAAVVKREAEKAAQKAVESVARAAKSTAEKSAKQAAELAHVSERQKKAEEEAMLEAQRAEEKRALQLKLQQERAQQDAASRAREAQRIVAEQLKQAAASQTAQKIQKPVQKTVQPPVVDPRAMQMPEASESSELAPSVNLIPDTIFEELRSRNRLRDLILLAGFVAVFIMAIYAGMSLYAQRLSASTSAVLSDIRALDANIASYESTRINAEQQYEHMQAIAEIVDGHIQWTGFFEHLEKWTLPTVYYQNMVGSAATGEFTFDVVTSDLRYMSAQVELLRQSPYVELVSTTSATQEEVITDDATPTNSNTNAARAAIVRFTMTVHVKPDLFHPAQ